MREQNIKSLIGIAIGTILFMELLIFGGWGIAVPIAVAIYYILTLWQSKILNIKQDIRSNILLIPIVMTALCFVFFDNMVLKFFNIIFLYGLIILNTSQQFKVNRFEIYSLKWFLEIIHIGVLNPINYLSEPIKIIKEEAKKRSNTSNSMFLKIIIGLLIGLPIVFIVTLLLMNTDEGFKNIIVSLYDKFNFDFISIFFRIFIFVIIFFPLYGFFYGLRNKKEIANTQSEKMKIKIFDYIIVITVTSSICAVYIIYCLSKLTYFISGFLGILPIEYTFAEYARKGFFECIPLGGINLILIIILTMFTKTEENKKRCKIIKAYTTYIIAFTLFLVISAFSKMWLYINAYGVTIMRIYVSWFLILGCMILVMIGIKTYYNKFKLIKSLFITFIIMFLGLNYTNIDYRIAKYDVQLYMEGKVEAIDALYQLSDSALEPLIKISDIDKKNTKPLLKKYKDRIYRETKWQDWNLVKYNGMKIFNEKK